VHGISAEGQQGQLLSGLYVLIPHNTTLTAACAGQSVQGNLWRATCAKPCCGCCTPCLDRSIPRNPGSLALCGSWFNDSICAKEGTEEGRSALQLRSPSRVIARVPCPAEKMRQRQVGRGGNSRNARGGVGRREEGEREECSWWPLTLQSRLSGLSGATSCKAALKGASARESRGEAAHQCGWAG
jgi:hypothetical protein